MYNFLSGLQRKLIAACMAVTLIPLIVVGLYAYQTASAALTNDVLETALRDATAGAEGMTSFLEGAADDVTFLSRSAPMRNLLKALDQGNANELAGARTQLADEFIAVAQTSGIYLKLRYLDATGQEIVEVEADGHSFRINPGDMLQNDSKDDSFINGMALPAGRVYTTRLRLETQGGVVVTPHVPGIGYATPVLDQGVRRGVVVLNVDARRFLEPMQSQAGQRQLFMVDPEGYYVAHPDPNKLWGRDLNTGVSLKSDYASQAQTLLGGGSGTIVLGDDLAAYVTIIAAGQDTTRWTLVSARPRNAALLPVQTFTIGFLGLAAVAWLAALVLAMLIARAITRPMQRLSRIAARISMGELDTEIDIRSQDEIGDLAEAISRMQASLQAAVERLRARRAA